jgi:hypothetical protein
VEREPAEIQFLRDPVDPDFAADFGRSFDAGFDPGVLALQIEAEMGFSCARRPASVAADFVSTSMS